MSPMDPQVSMPGPGTMHFIPFKVLITVSLTDSPIGGRQLGKPLPFRIGRETVLVNKNTV